MYAVGRIRNYITRGVYTVSAPFHPFGGAVDIIVVKQRDGTFKSSPWYLQFGKFQGVLKTKEKTININVNGVDADFHMYLDHKGEAYFLREVDAEEVDSLSCPSFSAEESDSQSSDGRPMNSRSCHCATDQSNLDAQINVGNGKIVTRSSSQGPRVLGLVVGRKSMKENGRRKGEDDPGVVREDLLEHAEIAADLLEVNWSTNLASSRHMKDNARFSAPDISRGEADKDLPTNDGEDSDENTKFFISETTSTDPESAELDAYPNKKLDEEQDFKRSGANGLEAFVHSETDETSYISSGGGAEVCVHSNTLYKTAKVISKANSIQETSALVANEHLVFQEVSADGNHGKFSNELQAGENMRDEDNMSMLQHCSTPIGDSQQYSGGIVSTEAIVVSPSEGSEEEQFLSGDIEDFNHEVVQCNQNIRRMTESLPNLWTPTDDLVVDDLHHSLGNSLDLNSESSKCSPLREGVLSCINSEADKEDRASQAHPTVEDAQFVEELNISANLVSGELSKSFDASNGSWRGWQFPFKRSRGMKIAHPAQNSSRSSDAENTSDSFTGMDGEKDVHKHKMKNKKLRAITPTPEQLASLNLREGKNTVTFTFLTSMLGPQQVDARIYLWKWDARVVISDVDGTITKSDGLGQFMPLVGMDWSQTGVTHLFSAIKDNGYQLLFLSARAISQAYHTRQFLFSLKQDGKTLPDGPVVISPDGLFPSLFREVIRRAPHEFKIACLEDIKALFPSEHSPFYAGFGNRDTDEFSYLKVGIPKGKIFIINPKGEVVVNRRVDTKSYASLHSLVHDMFPPMSSSEQEDFNSWNYWKLPAPGIDS